MQNLRLQLIFSHLFLLLIMSMIMVAAVLEFVHLGHSISHILANNYNSVLAAEDMKETLERQDSAATFFLAGQRQQAQDQYETNLKLFQEAYNREAHNITEPGEGQLAAKIGEQFTQYRHSIASLLYADPPMTSTQARDYYFGTLEKQFLQIKQGAQAILDLNQKAIVRGDRRAREEAHEASVLSVLVTTIAFLLSLIFAVRMIGSALAPLRILAQQAEAIGVGRLNQRIELRRSDEIGALALAFNQMAERLQEAHRLEEARLSRAERMSDAALESLYDPVVVTDPAGCIVHLNHAAEGLFGTVDQAGGRPVSQVVHERVIVEAIERAVQLERVSAAEDEGGLALLQVAGVQRFYRVRATPMRDEKNVLVGAALVLEDVTHLRELDRLKSEFISVASHELRTPVTSLLLSAQLMEEGAVGQLTPPQMEIVAAQKEDLQRLDRMMQDLLDITRLEAGVISPHFEIVCPVDLISAALSAVSAQAETKGLALKSCAPKGLPSIRADRGQMVRVLVNLLSNAVRHTKSGSISVDVSASPEELSISVADTGTGIPPEYLPRVFERFVQVPGATRGGAGLGLSIAQTILRAHGGSIRAVSEFGKGSTFTVVIPTLDERK